MASPLPNEDKIYERIKNEKIAIHPLVWELLTHHIGNDLFVIMLMLEGSVLNTRYPKPLNEENAKRVYGKALEIKKLLEKLKEATGKGFGF